MKLHEKPDAAEFHRLALMDAVVRDHEIIAFCIKNKPAVEDYLYSSTTTMHLDPETEIRNMVQLLLKNFSNIGNNKPKHLLLPETGRHDTIWKEDLLSFLQTLQEGKTLKQINDVIITSGPFLSKRIKPMPKRSELPEFIGTPLFCAVFLGDEHAKLVDNFSDNLYLFEEIQQIYADANMVPKAPKAPSGFSYYAAVFGLPYQAFRLHAISCGCTKDSTFAEFKSAAKTFNHPPKPDPIDYDPIDYDPIERSLFEPTMLEPTPQNDDIASLRRDIDKILQLLEQGRSKSS